MTNFFTKLLQGFRSTPQTPEEFAAEAEAKQMHEQMETIRLSQRTGSQGENYQSGRPS
ncbi:MAG TPA: hypothetical protein VGP69_07965 [Gaiellaceae bacterium]|jgi:hypothetical protein|nr:hypothetical protein [Gaiellaceae bacterium]